MRRLTKEYAGMVLSDGTLKDQDLINSCLTFLGTVAKKCQIVRKVVYINKEVYVLNVDEHGAYLTEDKVLSPNLKAQGVPISEAFTSQELAWWIFNEDMFDLLNEIAPVGCRFGAHEGDGACFGFWSAC